MGEWLRIEPEYRTLLSQLGLDSLDALLSAPGTRVRHSLHTNTYRLGLPPAPSSPKAFYIKAYREEWPNPRYLLRASRALGEWRALHGVRARGVSAARPVAVGERRRFGGLLDAVLVTEEVPGSIDAERFLTEFYARPHTHDWCRQKRTYLEALARFTRAMHDAGYVSRGFHPRNILIASSEEGPDFAIIDNPRGLLLPFGALARWLGVRDLAALDRRASAYFSRTDRLRFLRAYAGRPLRQCRRLLQRVGARTRVGAAGRATVHPQPGGPVDLVRDGRCWAAYREPGGDGSAQPKLPGPTEMLRTLAPNPSPGGRGEDEGARCVRKWQRASPLPLYARYGPLGREWQNLRVLEGLGLTVPCWLAFAQERARGLARREVLVVAAMSDVEGLAHWLQKLTALAPAGARSLRRALAETLGRAIGRAHGGGFSFRTFSAQDLGVRFPASAANVPVASSAEGAAAEPQPVFLHVGAGERRRRLSQRKRVRDLVSLATSFSTTLRSADMLSFFRGYLGRRLTSADRALVREVLVRYMREAGPSRPLLAASRRTGDRR